MLLLAWLLLQMSVFVGGPLVAFIPLLPAFLLLLSSLLLLVANVNAIAYVIDVSLHACCCSHCSCWWRPLISWCSHCCCCWPSCYFWRPWCCWDSCCCFFPTVAGAPAVSGVLAVASIPTYLGVPILAGILYNEIYQNGGESDYGNPTVNFFWYRTINMWKIRLKPVFFAGFLNIPLISPEGSAKLRWVGARSARFVCQKA